MRHSSIMVPLRRSLASIAASSGGGFMRTLCAAPVHLPSSFDYASVTSPGPAFTPTRTPIWGFHFRGMQHFGGKGKRGRTRKTTMTKKKKKKKKQTEFDEAAAEEGAAMFGSFSPEERRELIEFMSESRDENSEQANAHLQALMALEHQEELKRANRTERQKAKIHDLNPLRSNARELNKGLSSRVVAVDEEVEFGEIELSTDSTEGLVAAAQAAADAPSKHSRRVRRRVAVKEARLSNLILSAVQEIISRREIHDLELLLGDRHGVVEIVDVALSDDQQSADVKWTTMSTISGENLTVVGAVLDSLAGDFQRHITVSKRLRYSPRLFFKYVPFHKVGREDEDEDDEGIEN